MTAQNDMQPALTHLLKNISQQVFPDSALYVIATPIGNAADISLRALHVLSLADAIFCEDTRTTKSLLTFYGISKPVISAHAHNEREAANHVISRLQKKERIALVSDAGTPSISDPGARMVETVRLANFRVIPIPGASAATTALSVSGLMSEKFYFAGFLPGKVSQRKTFLENMRNVDATLVFYEAPHRVIQTIEAMQSVFEQDRKILIARELTKLFEKIHQCRLANALDWLMENEKQVRGEFVLLLEGKIKRKDELHEETVRILSILLSEYSTSQAVSLAARMTGMKKNLLYQHALQMKDEK